MDTAGSDDVREQQPREDDDSAPDKSFTAPAAKRPMRDNRKKRRKSKIGKHFKTLCDSDSDSEQEDSSYNRKKRRKSKIGKHFKTLYDCDSSDS
jgi:hypothetical protein